MKTKLQIELEKKYKQLKKEYPKRDIKYSPVYDNNYHGIIFFVDGKDNSGYKFVVIDTATVIHKVLA